MPTGAGGSLMVTPNLSTHEFVAIVTRTQAPPAVKARVCAYATYLSSVPGVMYVHLFIYIFISFCSEMPNTMYR